MGSERHISLRMLPVGVCPRRIPANGDMAFAWLEWAQVALQMGLEDCAAVSKQAFGRQSHSISRDAQCCAHLRPTEPFGSGTTVSQCP